MKNLEFSLKEGNSQELEFQPLGITSGEIDGKTYVIVADYFGPEGINDNAHLHNVNGRFIIYAVTSEGDNLILSPSIIYPLTGFPGGDIPKKNPLWTEYPSTVNINRAQSLAITDEEILFTSNLESWLNGMNFRGVSTLRIPYEKGFGKTGDRTESIGFLENVLYSVNNYGTKIAAYSIDRDKKELNMIRSAQLDKIEGMARFLKDEVKTPVHDPDKTYEEQKNELDAFLMYGIGIRDGNLWLITEHRNTKVEEGIYVIDPENFKLLETHISHASFPNEKITGNGLTFLDTGLLITQYTFDREKDLGEPKLVFIPNKKLM